MKTFNVSGHIMVPFEVSVAAESEDAASDKAREAACTQAGLWNSAGYQVDVEDIYLEDDDEEE